MSSLWSHGQSESGVSLGSGIRMPKRTGVFLCEAGVGACSKVLFGFSGQARSCKQVSQVWIRPQGAAREPLEVPASDKSGVWVG